MVVIWLTGNTGAGKTTIAKQLLRHIPNSVNLDGDEMREVWRDLELSLEDRLEQNLRVARMANVLENQSKAVIVSVIAPTKDIRQRVEYICFPFWIHIDDNSKPTKEKPYERPFDPIMRIKPDNVNGRWAAEEIVIKLYEMGVF